MINKESILLNGIAFFGRHAFVPAFCLLVAGADCETAIRAPKTRVFDTCTLTSHNIVTQTGLEPTIPASQMRDLNLLGHCVIVVGKTGLKPATTRTRTAHSIY